MRTTTLSYFSSSKLLEILIIVIWNAEVWCLGPYGRCWKLRTKIMCLADAFHGCKSQSLLKWIQVKMYWNTSSKLPGLMRSLMHSSPPIRHSDQTIFFPFQCSSCFCPTGYDQCLIFFNIQLSLLLSVRLFLTQTKLATSLYMSHKKIPMPLSLAHTVESPIIP